MSLTRPTISLLHRACNGSIAQPDGFDNQHTTTQAVAKATTVATSAGVPCHGNPDRPVDIILMASLRKEQFGAGGRCTQLSNKAAKPRTPGPRHAPLGLSSASFLRIHAYQHFQCLKNALVWSPKHNQRVASCIPFRLGVVFRPSPMRVPANASSAEGQCGKLTTLPLRANANTNTDDNCAR